jgi:uncharacterized protein (UPF0147 family)
MNTAPEELAQVMSIFSQIYQTSILPKQRAMAAEQTPSATNDNKPECCKNKVVKK